MEWVEVTGKTVEEAKEMALDQLGVDESDAEFEVVEEPKAGLFGLLRSHARVRARVMPATARPKVERRDRKRSSGPGGAGGGARRERPSPSSSGGAPKGGGRPRSNQAKAAAATAVPAPPASQEGVFMHEGDPDVDAGELAEEFVEGLLNRFGAKFDLERRDLDDDTVEIAVTGDDLGMLIGPRGQTLAAVQELARTVVQRKAPGARTRILVDIAGYRLARREALERFTRGVAEQVMASGVARVLEPMTAPDRKVVHDTANTIDGVSTTSEGEEPRRRVVIMPDGANGDN